MAAKCKFSSAETIKRLLARYVKERGRIKSRRYFLVTERTKVTAFRVGTEFNYSNKLKFAAREGDSF
jgi:ribosomal protein S18